MTTIPIKVLFHFAKSDLDILEIKRLDLPETADKADLFHWLQIPQNGPAQKLTFVSMNSENDHDSREFEQGSLSFNKSEARFQAEQTQKLQAAESKELSPTLTQKIQNYLA